MAACQQNEIGELVEPGGIEPPTSCMPCRLWHFWHFLESSLYL